MDKNRRSEGADTTGHAGAPIATIAARVCSASWSRLSEPSPLVGIGVPIRTVTTPGRGEMSPPHRK